MRTALKLRFKNVKFLKNYMVHRITFIFTVRWILYDRIDSDLNNLKMLILFFLSKCVETIGYNQIAEHKWNFEV